MFFLFKVFQYFFLYFSLFFIRFGLGQGAVTVYHDPPGYPSSRTNRSTLMTRMMRTSLKRRRTRTTLKPLGTLPSSVAPLLCAALKSSSTSCMPTIKKSNQFHLQLFRFRWSLSRIFWKILEISGSFQKFQEISRNFWKVLELF